MIRPLYSNIVSWDRIPLTIVENTTKLGIASSGALHGSADDLFFNFHYAFFGQFFGGD